jgi:hypothetical protein
MPQQVWQAILILFARANNFVALLVEDFGKSFRKCEMAHRLLYLGDAYARVDEAT